MRHALRLVTLQHQGLTTLRPFGKGIQATERTIEHLGYIQIDTLSVVERAHHHTLWTRLPDYHTGQLSTLVRERRVFEYWFHAASYLPMKNYRFVLPQMAAVRRGEWPYLPAIDRKYMRPILERIRIDGPLKSRNFASITGRNSKWWDWKPAKRALEKMFMQGDLMITDRQGMEKVYDLTERVLPDSIDTREPTLVEFAEHLIDLSLNANGYTTLKKLTHLRPGGSLRKVLESILRQKVEQGTLSEYKLSGMPTIYMKKDMLNKRIKKPANLVHILSPFDNAIIHRDQVHQVFDFEYKLECYTPKDKRKFGYFCLPILFQDQLVGRVDCKAHRKTGCLELVHLHIESSAIELDKFILGFTKAIIRFAEFNKCNSIRLTRCSPKRLTSTFRKALKWH